MAFDGITVAAVTQELENKLNGGRIAKVSQPESDELIITVKTPEGQFRLLLSADASLPFVYLTEVNKPGPMTAPNFCMVLRKHLQGAKILGFSQPGMERIIRMKVEHYNEMGDLCQKTLIIEIMGKHSNIILVDENEVIIDSIKRISGMVSSVREVLPGKPYFVPETMKKENPLLATEKDFLMPVNEKPMPVLKAIYNSYTGISPVLAATVCLDAGVDEDKDCLQMSDEERSALWRAFSKIMFFVKKGEFHPEVYYEGEEPKEFSAIPLKGYERKKEYESISALLFSYYEEKDRYVKIRQKSGDLRRVVQTATERTVKKYDLQLEQLKDTEKREKYRVYGELLNTYGYQIPQGEKSAEVLNYYTNEMITIPLDETMSAIENAKRYFAKYGKLKRTYEALITLTEETKASLEYLESIAMELNIAVEEEDLIQIKEEMMDAGFLKRKGNIKKTRIKSKPFHYISSDGFDIYVGKNNYQNEELTFKFAGNKDWWFHAKNAPGSHVIVKTEGKELPDRTFEEAAALAAFYSKVSEQDKVEVDYTERRNVKKPAGGAPGFVVYYTNYSMMAIPKIQNIKMAEN